MRQHDDRPHLRQCDECYHHLTLRYEDLSEADLRVGPTGPSGLMHDGSVLRLLVAAVTTLAGWGGRRHAWASVRSAVALDVVAFGLPWYGLD